MASAQAISDLHGDVYALHNKSCLESSLFHWGPSLKIRDAVALLLKMSNVKQSPAVHSQHCKVQNQRRFLIAERGPGLGRSLL